MVNLQASIIMIRLLLLKPVTSHCWAVAAFPPVAGYSPNHDQQWLSGFNDNNRYQVLMITIVTKNFVYSPKQGEGGGGRGRDLHTSSYIHLGQKQIFVQVQICMYRYLFKVVTDIYLNICPELETNPRPSVFTRIQVDTPQRLFRFIIIRTMNHLSSYLLS